MKANGKDFEKTSLIFQGFIAYIDHLFWFLPFFSPKQAYDMMVKKMSNEHWITKRDEIKAEHLMELAPADLRMGWKAWIAGHRPGKEGAGAPAVVPAAGITSVIQA